MIILFTQGHVLEEGGGPGGAAQEGAQEEGEGGTSSGN